MRKRFLVIGIVLALAALATFFLLSNPQGDLLGERRCPAEWYYVTGMLPNDLKSYYVFVGSTPYRLSGNDVEWIKTNCPDLKPIVTGALSLRVQYPAPEFPYGDPLRK